MPSGTAEMRRSFRRRASCRARVARRCSDSDCLVALTTAPVLVREPAGILPAGVVVSVDRSVGRCPQAKFIFTGRVTAPRPGLAVTVEWIKLDGLKTAAEEVKPDGGVQTVERRLEYTYSGNQAVRGDVVLHMLAPVDISSQPLHIEYQSPDGGLVRFARRVTTW